MDTLDKLVALIREFAEKASVPATEAAQAVVRAVAIECETAIWTGVILLGGMFLLGLLFLVFGATMGGEIGECIAFTGLAGIAISVFLSVIVGGASFPSNYTCAKEPLGYTLKRMVLK